MDAGGDPYEQYNERKVTLRSSIVLPVSFKHFSVCRKSGTWTSDKLHVLAVPSSTGSSVA